MFRSPHNCHLHIGRDAYRDHTLADFRPQADTCIESFLDDIDEPALIYQFKPDIRISLFKYRQLWQQAFINRVLAGIDTHRAGGRLSIVRQRGKPKI